MSRSTAPARAQRGVSSLWPLLPFEGPSSRAATLPEGVAERILAEALSGWSNRDTLRAVRLVSRATRAAVDARVRWVELRRSFAMHPDMLKRLARFPGLEKVDVLLNKGAADPILAGLIRGLPRLRRLRQLKLDMEFFEVHTLELRGKVLLLARALPAGLETLTLTPPRERVTFEALVGASAALPALRSLTVYLPYVEGPAHVDTRQLQQGAVRRALQQGGAWSNLRELKLGNLTLQTFAALAAATQLTALRELELHSCLADDEDKDGGLRLLAEAPWMRQLTALVLDEGGEGESPTGPTDALFTGLALPMLEELRMFYFEHTAADPATGAPAGLATAALPALTSLYWWPHSCTVANLDAIAAAPWYAGLSKLNVSVCSVEDPGDAGRVLLGAPFVALTELIVLCDVVSRDVVRAIAAGPIVNSLRSLDLASIGYAPIQRARVDDWAAFARAPFTALRKLSIESDWLSTTSEAAIRRAPWITQVTQLYVYGEITDTSEDDEEEGE